MPENFNVKILDVERYRDYLEEDGIMKEDRENDFEVFIYFLNRSLTSVNLEANKYKEREWKTIPLSAILTVSDEVFAFLMLENYHVNWKSWKLIKRIARAVQGYSARNDVRLKCPYTGCRREM